MVLDSSILVAILLAEADRKAILEQMRDAPRLLLSTGSLIEAGIVLMRHGAGDFEYRLDPFLQRARIEIVPVDQSQAVLAREGYRRYGKGRHLARLNFGDCFAYALAIRTGEPLLFKGNDFGWTDVTVA